MMSSCCGENVIIRSGDELLCDRLLNYGEEEYAELSLKQRVIMWVYVFYDEKSQCPACKAAYADMFTWFNKYNLFNNPMGCARAVIEPTPEQNLIYTDLGMNKLPAILFCDEKGRIVHIKFDFPDDKWLTTHILPFFQEDGKLL